MKFMRSGDDGLERTGVMDAAGRIRDVSEMLEHMPYLDLAAALDDSAHGELPAVGADVRLGARVDNVHNFIAVELNHSDHVTEVRLPHPRGSIEHRRTR